MKRNFLIIALILFTQLINAQVEEFMIDTEAEETEIVIEKKQTNSKYKTEKINDVYDLYWDRYTDSYYKDYGILKNGIKLLPNIFRKESYNYSGGLIIFSLNKVYGLYNLENERWGIPLLYQSLSELGNGLYKANFGNKYGIIDANNNIIEEFKWASLNQIYNVKNYYKVSEKEYSNRQYGILSLIDKKLTIPCKYSEIEEISNSSYFKVRDGAKYNIVDINDKTKFSVWYDELYLPLGGRKLYIVKLNGKMGVIDENENMVVPIEYEDINPSAYRDGSYLAKNKEGKYGFITLDGRVTLAFDYSNIEKKNNNNIIAMRDDKCGLLQVNDGMPYEVAACDYSSIVGHNKIFIVEKDKKFGIIDLYGKLITKIEYDNIVTSSISYYSDNKPYIANKGNKYYLLNNSGEFIIDIFYSSIKYLAELSEQGASKSDFSFFVVQNPKSKKLGLVDLFGKEVITPVYDEIVFKHGNIILVGQNKKLGLFDIIKNKYIVPVEYDQIIVDKNSYIAIKGNEFYKIDVSSESVIEKL